MVTPAAVDLLEAPWPGQVEPRDSVADVIFSVESGEADAGVVPLETSVEGDVSSTIDELVFRSSMCFINEELIVPVNYVVAGTAGARAAGIERVVTTTVAAAQCRRFLEGADAEVELVDSIAAACRRVADADGLAALAREMKAAGTLRERGAWVAECQQRKRTMQRKTHFDAVPMKPQRVYEEMNRTFGKDTCYVSTIGLSQIAAAQFLHVYKPRHWINCGQAGPLGWTIPAALGVCAADPDRRVVAISGDYDFQFMIEELAVGAQFKLPYLHVLVNNAYLGLIRQSQRGFDMDFCVQLAFENINAPQTEGYGVDHVGVVEGLGCKAIRVRTPEEIQPAFAQAQQWMEEFRVPVVVEIILERVTNIAMGTEIDAINEFEELAERGEDAPTAISMLD